MYSSRFDPEQRVFYMTLEGFWSQATVVAFSTTMLARGVATRLRHGQFAIVADARTFPVQAAAVAEALERTMHQSAKITAGPFYTVVNSMLSKAQAVRVSTSPNSHVFTDWDEAQAALKRDWIGRFSS